MSNYAVAHLDEIDEISDGRCPQRPIRHHFGITSFGVNAWTGREAGDRIINEHDEVDENEELYLVHSGRARFELDGEQVDAPIGTLVFAPPGVKRTASPASPATTPFAIFIGSIRARWSAFGRAKPGGCAATALSASMRKTAPACASYSKITAFAPCSTASATAH